MIILNYQFQLRPGQKEPEKLKGKIIFLSVKQNIIDWCNNELLENAEVFGNYYGTPKKFVEDHIKQGTNVIFDIDWQGAREIAAHKEFHVVSIFVLPPSIKALRERLEARSLDSKEIINERMTKAKSEISHYNEYKYVILNDDLNKAVSNIKYIIDYYSLRNIRPRNYTDFIEHNLV